MLHVSSGCCIILSSMTESKIGHLRSTQDITLSGLIGTDWRGDREGQRDSAKYRNMEWLGTFKNVVVHQFCIKSFLFVYPSVLNALTTAAFSNCFQMPWAKGIFLLFYTPQAQLRNKKDIMHEVRTFWRFNHLVWLINTTFVSMFVGRWMLFTIVNK